MTEKAETEAEYRTAVRDATAKAEALRQDRVEPETGKEIRAAIEAIVDSYRSIFGYPDLPELTPIRESATALTVDQKLGLARQLEVLAQYAPEEHPSQIVQALRGRKEEVESVDLGTNTLTSQAEVLKKYPDHPSVRKTAETLIERHYHFWTFPWTISGVREALGSYEGNVDEKTLEKRRRELETAQLFSGLFYGVIVFLVVSCLWIVTDTYFEERSRFQDHVVEVSSESAAPSSALQTAYDIYHNSVFFRDEAMKWARNQFGVPASIFRKSGFSENQLNRKVNQWNEKKARRALIVAGDKELMRRHLQFAGNNPEEIAKSWVSQYAERDQYRDAFTVARHVYSDPSRAVGEAAEEACITKTQCQQFAGVLKDFFGVTAERPGANTAEKVGMKAALALLKDDNELPAANLVHVIRDTTTGDRNSYAYRETTSSFWKVAEQKLVQAAEKGDARAVRALLSIGTSSYHKNKINNKKLVIKSAKENNVDVLRLLINNGTLSNKTEIKSIIKKACESGSDRSVSLLYDYKKNSISSKEEGDHAVFGGGSERSGIFEGIGPCSPVDSRWTFHKTEGTISSSTAIVDSLLYVNGHEEISAINLYNGNKKWQKKLSNNKKYGYIVASGGLVYVSNEKGEVYAVSAKTGKIKWAFKLDEEGRQFYSVRYSSLKDRNYPAIRGNKIYTSNNSYIYSLNKINGKLLKKYDIRNLNLKRPPFLTEYDGKIYVSAEDKVCVLMNKKIKCIWDTKFEVISPIAAKSNLLFFGSSRGIVYAFDYEKREVVWSERFAEVVYSPSVKGGAVFVLDERGEIHALDSKNGKVKWVKHGSSSDVKPSIVGDTVYITENDYEGNEGLHAISAKTGDTKWVFNTDSDISGPPIIKDASLYFTTVDKVYSLD